MVENSFSTGEKIEATVPRIPLAKLTPLRSKVIRNNDETSNRTNKSRERLPPLLATTNSLANN
jgi:antitoxin (DNA-binding transcriptional repressor) of toxin-antitoxin stability system